MKVKEIHYRRVKNLGNYETETVEFVGTVEDDETVDEAYTEIRREVKAALGLHGNR